MKEWRAFERLVALLTSDEYDNSYTVIPNAKIKGYISGRKRQIDVLVDYRYDTDLSRRIIIDAKNLNRPIDIKDVESFEGMMKDVAAKRGFIVCTKGHTKAAKKRAQDSIGIRLIESEDIDAFDLNSWDKCQHRGCAKGLVLWDTNPGLIIGGLYSIQSIGKCDECGRFHIWCWDCGDKIVLKKEQDWQCSCKGPWFWLTAVELEKDNNGKTNEANYLLLVLGNGMPHIVDRRPL